MPAFGGEKMKPNTRKLALTAHITLSGGWIGSALAYLGLVVAAMTSTEEHTLRSVWSALNVIGWLVIVPLAVSALGTGLLMALGTSWGLVRHYWVLCSLLLTVLSTGVLLMHMMTVSSHASTAVQGTTVELFELQQALRGELLHAGMGIIVLLVIQTLNVYKPRGLTGFGRRAVVAEGTTSTHVATGKSTYASKSPLWVRAIWIHAAVLLFALVILHVAGGGFPQH
jgi:hypothetical protein